METEGTRAPAPGALAVVQAFVNTVDMEPGTEELRGPAELRSWLAAFVLMLITKPHERTWMMRLAYAGLCLLLLGILIRVLKI